MKTDMDYIAEQCAEIDRRQGVKPTSYCMVDSVVGAPEPESTATRNMRTDRAYAPYCMRCPGLRRMRRVSAVLAECAVCGAVHDISGPNS